MSILARGQQVTAFRAVVLLLVVAAALTFVPLWAPLLLAAWVAVLSRPLLQKIAKLTGGRERAAGVLVVLLVVLMFVPLALALVSLTSGAIDLVRTVLASKGAKGALIAIASEGGEGGGAGGPSLDFLRDPQRVIALVQEYGAQAAGILSGLAGAATEALLGLFIFVYAVFVFLVDGPSFYRWFEGHAPLNVRHTRRLTAAFNETGRGLFVGVGLTGLAQGAVATITYLALGVPRALVLGLITCFASLIPSFGTALVWAPVAIGLALAGKTVAALVMSGVGLVVIGTVDNVLRPVFSRFGNLELSSFVLLVSIFGGLTMFGGWGLLVGPLFVRLAKEALVLARVDSARERRAQVVAVAPPPQAS